MMEQIEIALPDDWHVHLRDGIMLEAVIGFTSSTFRYSLVMPNLVPPIRTATQARAYRSRILEAAKDTENPEFSPLMTFYFGDLPTEDLAHGHRDGDVFAVKYYPAGVTTNSGLGGSAISDYLPFLEMLASMQIPLLVHAESVDPRIDIFSREAAFLELELQTVCEALPELSITVEHISTRKGVEFVEAHPSVAATITPHHLARDRSDLLGTSLRPDLYCKPVINSADDRLALVRAATSGSHQFFLGTDSAPHPSTDKLTNRGLPGVFNAPNAIAVVAEVFHNTGKLEQLEAFLSLNGAKHYGFRPATGRLLLRRRSAPDTETSVSEITTSNGHRVSVFGEREAARWDVEPLCVSL